ncbi:glucokinase [Parvibaculum sp.]|uniref:glucokinase n=1 Tax=Parvibaculum sp. TaxID=2024848 RepID=UPI00391B6D61
MSAPVLVADIGGTNARFALAHLSDRGIEVEPPVVYRTAEHASFDDALQLFLASAGRLALSGVAACAAGPVEGEGQAARIDLTNFPWEVSVAALSRATGMANPSLVNDFAAVALAVPALGPHELHAIGPALVPVPGAPAGLLGAGTGLGMSAIIFGDGVENPVAGEGGHADLAANSAREAELIAHLRARHGHVSVERVLSGPGLIALYDALCALGGAEARQITPPGIAARAHSREDDIAVEAVQLFCGFLGSVAGNLALTLGAQGGIYIGGGIVPGWLAQHPGLFDEALFRARFEAKGRMSHWLARVPVFVIRREDAALLGLARLAFRTSR